MGICMHEGMHWSKVPKGDHVGLQQHNSTKAADSRETHMLFVLSLQAMSEVSYLTSFLWSDREAYLIRLAYKGAIAFSSCQVRMCAESSCARVPCLQAATLLCLTVTVLLQMRAFICQILQTIME